jgi:hypothetical protein
MSFEYWGGERANGPCVWEGSFCDRRGGGDWPSAALKFADEGAKVVVSDLNGDGGTLTATLVTDHLSLPPSGISSRALADSDEIISSKSSKLALIGQT